MTTSGLAALTNYQPVGIKEARTQHLMKRWHEKTTTKKAFLSSVSLLSLAACGSGSDSYVFKSDLSVAEAVSQFSALRADGYSIKDSAENIAGVIGTSDAVLAGATEIELASADAITVAQSNALAALDNFVGFAGVVTLDAAGGATEISVGDLVNKYVLAGANSDTNTLNISATNLDVNVDGADSDDTINVAGLTVTGTYALGAGINDVELGDGANISGATITATGGFFDLKLADDASVVMTVEQHNLAHAITGAGSEQVTLSNAGTLIGNANIETYVLANAAGNDFTIGVAGHDLTGSADHGDTVRTGALTILTGTTLALGGTTADVLVVSTSGADLSGINSGSATTAGTLSINGIASVSMTDAQHNAISTFTATGTNEITLTTVAAGTGISGTTTTGDAAVEDYALANVANNDFTLGATGQDVTGSADHGDTVRTGAITDLTGTTLALGGTGTDELVVTTTATNLSGINTGNVTTAETLTIDDVAAVSMTTVQHNAFTTIAAAGTNTITLTTVSSSGTTGNASVEAYVLANVSGNDFTLGVAGQDVTSSGASAADTIRTGTLLSFAGTTLSLADADDTLVVGTTGTDLSLINAGNATTAETLTINALAGVSMTSAQHNAFTTINATGTGSNSETITLTTVSSVGTTGNAAVETYNIQAASSFTLGAASQNVTEIQTAQQNASSTLVFGSDAYSGTFTGFGPADVLQAVNGTDISGVTGLDTGVLDFQDATATVRLNALQNGSLTILASGADSGTQTIQVDEVDTFSGDANVEKYEVVTGSTVTLGALGQSIEETGLDVFGTNSTLIFGAGAYSGTFTTFEAEDILKVVNGTNLSGTNLTIGTLDFQDAAATVTMSEAQHAGFTFTELDGSQTVVLTTAGSVTSKSGVENYYLSDTGSTTFTQSESSDAVTVFSGVRDDLIITAFADANRNGLTIDLSSGGNDTVRILNDTGAVDSMTGLVTTDFGGFGGNLTNPTAPSTADQYNDASFATTASDWSSVGSPGSTTYADIHGFTASATDNGRDTVQLVNLNGGYVDEVNRTTTDLTGVSSGSILEINSASFTVSGDQFGNLQTVATMLDSLSNVEDGNYYIIVYNGQDANADAALYFARATEGDGFDYADSNGVTGGYDTDSVELLAVFHEVGSNQFSSLNFETYAQVA